MELSAGTLVNVTTDGPVVDGIVFDRPSNNKVVVAVVDRARGPVFRTVKPETLTERTEAGDGDQALLLLIKRTAPAHRGAARAGSGVGQGRKGFTRAATHRSTGK
ncbi:MAG: hypothetical protein JHC95_22795 [Solirubrobacteraceae bacterium]|nr:hypothetical protein [Solirubrobacteraceae bacterium]